VHCQGLGRHRLVLWVCLSRRNFLSVDCPLLGFFLIFPGVFPFPVVSFPHCFYVAGIGKAEKACVECRGTGLETCVLCPCSFGFCCGMRFCAHASSPESAAKIAVAKRRRDGFSCVLCVCVLRGLSCDLPLNGYLAFFSACSCACMLMAFITALPAFSIFAARLPVT